MEAVRNTLYIITYRSVLGNLKWNITAKSKFFKRHTSSDYLLNVVTEVNEHSSTRAAMMFVRTMNCMAGSYMFVSGAYACVGPTKFMFAVCKIIAASRYQCTYSDGV